MTNVTTKFGKNQGTDLEKGAVPIKHTGRMQLGIFSLHFWQEVGPTVKKSRRPTNLDRNKQKKTVNNTEPSAIGNAGKDQKKFQATPNQ